MEYKEREEKDTDKVIGCSSSGNSIVVEIFQNLDLKKEVEYKDGEEEETDKAIGCSSSGNSVVIVAFDNLDTPSSLHSVQVSLDRRTFAGVKICNRLSNILQDFSYLGVLHLCHMFLCEAVILQQPIAAILDSIHQVVARLPCPEVWSPIVGFRHGVQIRLVRGLGALVELQFNFCTPFSECISCEQEKGENQNSFHIFSKI